jgi:hypothetical protein
LAIVVLPLVDTVVVAFVLPDFVVTVFVEAVGLLVCAASAGIAISATAAIREIDFMPSSSIRMLLFWRRRAVRVTPDRNWGAARVQPVP